MSANDCTIVIDESALSALYRWLLSLADGDDQPAIVDDTRREDTQPKEEQHDAI